MRGLGWARGAPGHSTVQRLPTEERGLIVNIRGTNGSGKSTVVRELMSLGKCRPLFGLLGLRAPEAYRLLFEGVDMSVYVLGPYLAETGGCDSVHPFDLVLQLAEKYSDRGHVVFEGSLVSDHYGRVGAFLERFGRGAVMAFMPADLEECLRRLRHRRAQRGDDRELNPKNTTTRYVGIQRVRQKVEQAGVLRVVDLPDTGAAQAVLDLIREDNQDERHA